MTICFHYNVLASRITTWIIAPLAAVSCLCICTYTCTRLRFARLIISQTKVAATALAFAYWWGAYAEVWRCSCLTIHFSRPTFIPDPTWRPGPNVLHNQLSGNYDKQLLRQFSASAPASDRESRESHVDLPSQTGEVLMQRSSVAAQYILLYSTGDDHITNLHGATSVLISSCDRTRLYCNHILLVARAVDNAGQSMILRSDRQKVIDVSLIPLQASSSCCHIRVTQLQHSFAPHCNLND